MREINRKLQAAWKRLMGWKSWREGKAKAEEESRLVRAARKWEGKSQNGRK